MFTHRCGRASKVIIKRDCDSLTVLKLTRLFRECGTGNNGGEQHGIKKIVQKERDFE
jgi:acyl-CoA-binding protein